MKEILAKADEADFVFIANTIDSYVNLSSDKAIREKIAIWSMNKSQQNRDALCELLENEIRYAGSADLAYLLRWMRGKEPGVKSDEIIQDVAKKLKVKLRPLANLEAKLERLVKAVVERQFLEMTPEQQREVLRTSGVGHTDLEAILSKLKLVGPAAVIPVIVAAAGREAAMRVMSGLVISIVSKIVGREAAKQLLTVIATRFPWWSEVLGPVAWGISIAWLGLEVQSAAYRKTVPLMLYLGLIGLRDGPEEGSSFWDEPEPQI